MTATVTSPTEVRRDRDRYEPEKAEIEIAAGSSQMVRLSLTVSRPAPDAPSGFDGVRPWVIRGGLFLTVAGVALGAGMTTLANKQAQSAAGFRAMIPQAPGQPPPCPGTGTSSTATICASLKSAGSKQSSFANASVGMFTLGGVAALATAGLWTFTVMTKDQTLFQPVTGRSSGPSVRLAPLVGQREGGAMMVGQW